MLAVVLLAAVLVCAMSAIPAATAAKPQPFTATLVGNDISVITTPVGGTLVKIQRQYAGLVQTSDTLLIPAGSPFTGQETSVLDTVTGKGNFHGSITLGPTKVNVRGQITNFGILSGSFNIVDATGTIQAKGTLNGTYNPVTGQFIATIQGTVHLA